MLLPYLATRSYCTDLRVPPMVLTYDGTVVPGTARLSGTKPGSELGVCRYGFKPYEFANLTSDPTGLGSTMGKVQSASDLSLKYRVLLENRWTSHAEWQFLPVVKWVMLGLACLHVVVTFASSTTPPHLFSCFFLAARSIPFAVQGVPGTRGVGFDLHPLAVSAVLT